MSRIMIRIAYNRNDNDHTMTTLPHAEHTAKKKVHAPHYTTTNLALFQDDFNGFVLKLVDVRSCATCDIYFMTNLCSDRFSQSSLVLSTRWTSSATS